MQALNALVFVFFALFASNPNDGGKGYRIPPHYALASIHFASQYPRTKVEDVVSILVAEHGGKSPYSPDSVGDGGRSSGLLQVSDFERRRFNWCHNQENEGKRKHLKKCGAMKATGRRVTREELFDWSSNLEIGAWNVNRIKNAHDNEARCSRGSSVFFEVELVDIGEDGELYTEHDYHEEPVEAFHSWTAHIPCSPEIRDALVECVEGVKCRDKREIGGRLFTSRCPTAYRDAIVEDLATWRRFELEEPPRYSWDGSSF